MNISRTRLVGLFSVLLMMMMFIGYLGWKNPNLRYNYSTESGSNFISRFSSSTDNNSGQNQKKVEIPDEDVIRILDVVNQMENRKPLLVTLVNNAYLPFTYSWLCNTKDMDVHKQVLLITTDTESKEKLNKLWPNVKVVAIRSETSSSGDQVYSHAGYVRLMIRRTQILLALLQNNIEIFLFEVDCLWVRNPVPVLSKNVNYDILVNPVSNRPRIIAGGFIYMFPTQPTKLLWNELNNKLLQLEKKIKSLPPGRPISEGENDQIYLSGLVAKKFGGVKPKVLPLEEYADGKWYSWTKEKRKSSNPYVINNNWALGNKNKISRAKEWGHWFIKEDNSCDNEQVKKIIKI